MRTHPLAVAADAAGDVPYSSSIVLAVNKTLQSLHGLRPRRPRLNKREPDERLSGLCVRRWGHSQGCAACCMLPGPAADSYLCTASYDTDVKIWDVTDGMTLRPPLIHVHALLAKRPTRPDGGRVSQ